MTDAVPWDLYRSFLALFREGSLSAAGRRLNLTQPTLGRHLAELEHRLGAALFTRSPQGLSPTITATTLEPIAAVMESAAEAMVRAALIVGDAVKGPVRIAASHIVGAEVLPQILASLVDHYPDLVIELVLSNQSEDLLRRDADIAVRMVRPSQNALLSRWIGEVKLGLFAAAGYLERHGVPRSLADLAQGHRLIGFDREPVVIESLEAIGAHLHRDAFALRVDNDLAQLAALRAGYGVGVCQVNIAARDPRLIRLLAADFSAPLPIWLVMHEDLKVQKTLRVVFDHLAAGLNDYLRETTSSPPLPGEA